MYMVSSNCNAGQHYTKKKKKEKKIRNSDTWRAEIKLNVRISSIISLI